MLTVTTTDKLDALRRRGDLAEIDLADTTRRLEEVLDEHRRRGVDLADALRDVVDLRKEKAQLGRACEEMAADVARYHREVVEARELAQRLLATHEQTVTQLLAEMRRGRAGRPFTDPELPEHTVQAFRTGVFGLVVVIGEPDDYYTDGRLSYTWRCLACGADSGVRTSDIVSGMRDKANAHAAQCRSVPIPAPLAPSVQAALAAAAI